MQHLTELKAEEEKDAEAHIRDVDKLAFARFR